MLRLASTTDPAWLPMALQDLPAVLVDHAHCEQKAAVQALALVSRYPDDPALVLGLSDLASDEARHLHRVATICVARGLSLGHPQQDPYAKRLLSSVRGGGLPERVDRLLVSALIEARSCERLQLLAAGLQGTDLFPLYDELWREEATHHGLFVDLALRSMTRAGRGCAQATRDVEARLHELAQLEAGIVASLPLRAAIH